MPIPVTVKGVGLTVELLLFRAYGRRGNTAAMLRQTTALNRGLAAAGAILPLGLTLTLPDLPAEAARPKRKGVSLFGD